MKKQISDNGKSRQKRKTVKDIRIYDGKKQALCTKRKKLNEYEWYEINSLHHERLKFLLRNIGKRFDNNIKANTEDKNAVESLNTSAYNTIFEQLKIYGS